MNLILHRTEYRPDGIISWLAPDEDTSRWATTLEHSYNCQPKLVPGNYICVRGMHRLHGMTEDFETFEITGVPGCTGILFHWGNYQSDSEGCVLIGQSLILHYGSAMISNSRVAFSHFMKLMEGINQFTLTVMG